MVGSAWGSCSCPAFRCGQTRCSARRCRGRSSASRVARPQRGARRSGWSASASRWRGPRAPPVAGVYHRRVSLLRRLRTSLPLHGASLVGLMLAGALVHACDVTGDPIVGGPTGTGADGAGGSAGSGNDCGIDGTPCAGGVCAGGVCCPTLQACGNTCCPGGDVPERCSFQRCVPPGTACTDDDDCPDGQICDHDLGEPVGGAGGEGGAATCPTPPTRRGRCVDPPPPCNPDEPPTAEAPLACLTDCEYRPESIGDAELRWSWGEESIITTPLVIPLDDDDCSGTVDQGDVPEIVIVSFANGNVTGNGRLRVLSTQSGSLEERWSAQPTES